MKGGSYKINYDVRRRWKCPACGAERRTPGSVTSVRCTCRPDQWLSVAELPRPPRSSQLRPVPKVLEFADLPASGGATAATFAHTGEPEEASPHPPLPAEAATEIPELPVDDENEDADDFGAGIAPV